MTKSKYILLVLAVLLNIAVGNAQARKQVEHKLRATAAGGYSLDAMNAPASNGGKGMLGIGYRLQYGKLIFDAGLEGGYRFVKDRLDSIYTEGEYTDIDGDSYHGSNYWEERRLQKQQGHVAVPLAVGFKVACVYGLLGVKPSVNIWAQNRADWLYTHIGDYEQYIYHVENNPEKGFPMRQPEFDERSMKIGLDLLVTAELGLWLDKLIDGGMRGYIVPEQRVHHYLGIFAEAGVPLLYESSGRAENVQERLRAVDEGKPVPVTVGVKYTLEVDFKSKHKCTTCMEK